MFYVVSVLHTFNPYTYYICHVVITTSVASLHGIVKYPLNASKSFAYCFKKTVNSDIMLFSQSFFVYYIEGKYAISYAVTDTFTQHI